MKISLAFYLGVVATSSLMMGGKTVPILEIARSTNSKKKGYIPFFLKMHSFQDILEVK